MFWKPDLAEHPLAVETKKIALDPGEKPDRKAACSNLWHDHRVPPARAKVFLEESLRWQLEQPEEDSGGKRNIVDCLRHHYETRVKKQKDPEFNNPAINAGNEAKKLSPFLRLCNVLNLSNQKLFYPLRDGLPAKEEYEEVFFRFPDNESAYPGWIDGKMTRPDDVRLTLAGIFDVLAGRNRDFPLQPTWVVPWDSFEEYLDEPADRWLEVLGMDRSPNSWLVCLQYELREVPRLLRPTQIDAGANHWHFPSPPTSAGGHPMDLLHPCGEKKLLAEFIHRQIGYDIRFWENARKSTGATLDTHETLKKTSGAKAVSESDLPEFLPARRRQHWGRLVIYYPAETHDWLAPEYL